MTVYLLHLIASEFPCLAFPSLLLLTRGPFLGMDTLFYTGIIQSLLIQMSSALMQLLLSAPLTQHPSTFCPVLQSSKWVNNREHWGKVGKETYCVNDSIHILKTEILHFDGLKQALKQATKPPWRYSLKTCLQTYDSPFEGHWWHRCCSQTVESRWLLLKHRREGKG